MRLLSIILIWSLYLSADISLPDNFQTKFNQTIRNDKGKVIRYSGTVSFKQDIDVFINHLNQRQEIRSKLFKWSYTSPTKKEVCTDGTQILVIDHDLEQVSKYLIDDGFDLEQILGVSQKISNRDYKAVYKEIEYLITLDSMGRLQKIVYTDSLDNNVKIVFINMRYNLKPFDDRSLECPVNPDYDVIEG
jgi:outer membrane lipoprotein carrier protein